MQDTYRVVTPTEAVVMIPLNEYELMHDELAASQRASAEIHRLDDALGEAQREIARLEQQLTSQ